MVQVPDDLAEPEHPHGDDDEADAVGQLRHLEREALGAGRHVGADQPEQEAEHHHADGVQERPLRQDDRRDQAEHHEREVLGRPEPERHGASGGPNAAIRNVATVPAKNEPIAAVASAAPARPCRAIWYPSSVVTTDAASPGRLTRIEVVEPPYCDP